MTLVSFSITARRQLYRALVVICAVVITISALGAQTRSALLGLIGRNISGIVSSVTDGDTVNVKLDNTGRTVKVRLEGIDAPENGEPFSVQARNAARVMLFDKRVQLKGMDVDRYDRLVARITIDGTDSSLELVKAGLACHFTYYSSDLKLAAAELDAKANRRGFWDPGAPKPGCVTSRTGTAAASQQATGPFHGNRESQVYHSQYCVNYNCKNCTVLFGTIAEAEKAGFRPAGDCLGKR